jgi:hypothetical protein
MPILRGVPVTWQTSEYPADIEICPHCGKKMVNSFDMHEYMMHPDKRKYPPEYLAWKRQQDAEFAKKKKKKTKK